MSTPAGIRQLCVAYDIAGYSSRDLHGQFDAQRRLASILNAACAAAGLQDGDYGFQQQGDGGLALLPTGGGVDDPRLLDAFLQTVLSELVEVNRFRAPDTRLRLRVALSEGVVFTADHGYVGDDIVGVFRMCDAAQVRDALAANPSAHLVIVAADKLYKDVFRHSLHSIPGDAFVCHTLRVKSFSADGWVYVPCGNTTASGASRAAEQSNGDGGPEGAALASNPVSLREILNGDDFTRW